MALPATDNFNRTNETPIAGNWTTVTGMGNCELVSNVVEVSSVGTDGAIRWNADTFANDQYSQVKLASLNTDANKCAGPAVRCAAASENFYSIRTLGPAGAGVTLAIYKNIGGANTQISTTSTTVNVGDIVKLQVVGSTLTAFVNGASVLTGSDTDLAAGFAGISIFVDSGVPADATIDDWEGGNVGASAAPFTTSGGASLLAFPKRSQQLSPTQALLQSTLQPASTPPLQPLNWPNPTKLPYVERLGWTKQRTALTTTYDADVLAHGAVAHWPLHDAQLANGTFPVSDIIGNASGSAPSGAGILAMQPGALSSGDAAAKLDGTATTFYTIPDNAALHLTGNLTVDCWFQVPTGTSGATRGLVAPANAAYASLLAIRFNGGQVHTTLVIGGAPLAIITTFNPALALDTWHYAAATYNGTDVYLYVDGVKVANLPASGALDIGTFGLNIGSNGAGTTASNFIGYLDEPALYNRALSSAEIYEQYRVGITGLIPSGLVPFEETDWPNPRGYSYPSDLRSFIDPTEVWLIGQDQFYGAAGQVPTHEWPNPLIGKRASLDFIQSILKTTLAPIVTDTPFAPIAWPNPGRRMPQAVTNLTSTFYYIIDDNVPFLPMEFVNPRGPAFLKDLRTWVQNLQQTTLAIPPVAPFSFDNWINPLSKQFPIDLRTFLNNVETQLIGQDQFYDGPGKPPQNVQWNVPPGKIGVIDLKTETLSLLQTTLKPVPPPPGTGHDLILVDGRLAKHLSGIIYVFLN